MGKCVKFCDSKRSTKKCTILRKNKRDDTTRNFDKFKSERLRKLNVVQKYRTACLKRYVYTKDVNRCRRPNKTFLIPVFHVQRRPDNPFNVKNVVEVLRKDQMTSPSNRISEQNQNLPVGEDICYSRLEKTKPRNWETIRYKYQLDYKEKIKMERENFLKEYAEKRKMAQKHQRAENIRTIYQNMEERMREVSRSVVVQRANDRQMSESEQKNKASLERQSQVTALSGRSEGRSNISETMEKMNFYRSDKARNDGCDSIDLTNDNDSSVSFKGSEVNQMRLVRTEHGNTHTHVNNNKIVTLPVNLEHKGQRKTKRDDFDFSIPFNDSNILIKVMTPDGRNPISLTNQSGSLLQDTLQYPAESRKNSNAQKRLSLDAEPKPIDSQPSTSSGNQWIQYLQNILNRTCNPPEDVKKTCNPPEDVKNKKPILDHSKTVTISAKKANILQSNDAIPEDCVNYRPIPATSTIQKPNVMKLNSTLAEVRHPTNYYDTTITARIRHDRPVVSNPRLIRPKVMHPSPYFRPDIIRNSQYNDHLEDRIGVPLTVPPGTQLPDPSHHMDYLYNHPNYHPEFNMVRNRPLDINHTNLMRQSVYSPYDSNFAQYRHEMERISQPCIDPYIQHVSPYNPSIGFLPPRQTAPGVYRYLNPQHVHPVWIYPHLLER